MNNMTFNDSFRKWWAFEILGVLFIMMSLFVMGHPITSYAGLVLYFALMFIVSGVLRIVSSMGNREVLKNWGWYVGGGVLDIIIGGLLLARMDIAAIALSMYAGFFILFGSIAAIFRASELRDSGFKGWGWPLFSGILGVVFSFMILTNLIFGAATIVLWTAMGFFMMGLFYIYLGVHLHRIHKGVQHIGHEQLNA